MHNKATSHNTIVMNCQFFKPMCTSYVLNIFFSLFMFYEVCIDVCEDVCLGEMCLCVTVSLDTSYAEP